MRFKALKNVFRYYTTPRLAPETETRKTYNKSMTEAKPKKKRIRYSIPCYKKVYSVYAYNRRKYGRIYKRLQGLAYRYDKSIFYRVNPYNVLKLCYAYKKGKLQHLGDERHIYRYRALECVLTQLAQVIKEKYNLLLSSDVLYYLYKRTGIAYYYDAEEPQAEYMPASRKNISIRLKANIRLLRRIGEGLELEEAVKRITEV